MKRIWLGTAIVVVVLIAYKLTDDWFSSPTDTAATLRPTYVAAEGKVEAMPGFDINLGTGELNGRISKILVKEGDQVQQGQIVAVLENKDLHAQVLQAERELVVANSHLVELESGARKEEILAAKAALEGATASMQETRSQLLRYRELYRQRLVSQSELDEREATFKAAQAAVKEAEQHEILLEEGPKPETIQVYKDQVQLAAATLDYARKRLDKTIIRSPLDGTVIERYLDEGEGVTPEIPILAISDLTQIWINAEVDETDIGRIQQGDNAQVTSNAYPGLSFRGSIRRIAHYAGERNIRPSNPAVNLGLKIVQVKIKLNESTPLRIGMTVDIEITPHEP